MHKFFAFLFVAVPVTAALAAGNIVINEIHYDPAVKTERVAFVEIHNRGTNTVDLSGWRFSDGIEYTISSGVSLAPGAYKVVAQNPAALQAKYGFAGALGPWIGGLKALGETVTLKNAAGDNEDSVAYQLGFPWPTVGDLPGNSIELIHPTLDNDLGGSWRSSAGAPTPGRQNSAYRTNAPPQVRQVDHTPQQPRAGEVVKITATITDPDGVTNVVLQYQQVDPGSYIELTDAAFTNNWVSLSMNDAGTNGDAGAGDGAYSIDLPAALQTHRRLVRYRIIANDSLGNSIRVPYADDPQPNFAYFCYNGVPEWRGALQPGNTGSNGVVQTFSTNVMGRLPAIQLIGKSNVVATATWFSRYAGDLYQWAGTMVYDGKVYDHIHYRARGGVWRYSMVKNMWKFDMNRGHDFEPRDNWGRRWKTPWTKVNLGASIQQGDYNHRGEQGMFESVGFRYFQLAGVPAPNTAFATFRVIDDAQEAAPASQFEGDFWGAYLLIEQEDGRFLDEHGLPDSNLYKMESGTGELNNLGPDGPVNKSDLNYILNNYTSATDQWWRTNWNLPKYYSYQAIVQGIHHFDISDDKNYFYFYNSDTRLWEVCSWDLDLTWSHNMYRNSVDPGGGVDRLATRILNPIKEAGTGPQAGTGVMRLSGTRPVFDTEFRNRVREIRDLLWNSDQAFKVIDEYARLLRGTNSGVTILDADRFQWDYNPKMNDSAYTPNLGKAGQGRYYAFPGESGTNASLRGSFNATVQIMKNYVSIRGALLDSLATDASKPNTPTVTATGPTNFPINRLTLRSSGFSGNAGATFASMKWRIGEVTDTNSPLYSPNEPHVYEIEPVWEQEFAAFTPDVTIPAEKVRLGKRYRARAQMKDNTGRASNWSSPVEFTVGESDASADLLNNLRITEMMYNPAPDGFEFIELHNMSSTVALSLAGVKFTQGIDYTFPSGATLAPGGYLVVIGTTNVAGFRAYYGLDVSVPVFGPYGGSLNNAGEQITLRTSAGGSDIASFNYSDGRGWPVASDGAGHSIVLLDAAEGSQGAGSAEFSGNWRASTLLRGSPGRADSVPATTVVLNEVVAHTDFTGEFDSNDWIELFNTTVNPITFGAGWYLSDDPADLKKWQIPASTTIPARGFVSFDETTGFHNPTNIGFGLNKAGEQVFLSYLPNTSEDRIVDAVSFKAQENDWSLGRYPDGAPFWYPLTPRTRNTTNAPPAASVVISEFLYHPPDLNGTNDNSLDEFIEIWNASSSPVALFNTNGAWRLNGGIDFALPARTLAFGEYLLVVNFDPTTNATQLSAFKTLYGISNPNLVIVGPYSGKLANNSDRIALEKPQAPDIAGDFVSWIIVDEVIYADQTPWPCGSDGSGSSLQRLSAARHGSDPLNWVAQSPSAGIARPQVPAGVPAITAAPASRIVATNSTVSFSVGVCGTPPFNYQWKFNGTNIANATNAALTLFNVQLNASGQYRVEVSNSAGPTLSEAATLIVQLPPIVTTHPQSQTIVAYTSASFGVTGQGTAPLQYQWRFNGANMFGATNQTLVLTNVQKSQEGNYSAYVFNTAGGMVSSNAFLTVNVPATITNQPASVTITNGSTAVFTVGATGTGTLRYQWRLNGAAIPSATNSSLAISNAQLPDIGSFTVVVTDSIGTATSQPAQLTVLMRAALLSFPQSTVATEGQNVTFSATATGTPPLVFRWIKGVGFATNLTGTVMLTNVTLASAGQYRVSVTNILTGVSGSPSPPFTLTILADVDRDGLPDVWEDTYGFISTNAADALLDTDGDRMINLHEYIAGTDPRDASSYLRIEPLTPIGTNAVLVQFNAVSNHSYTVQFNSDVTGGAWSNLASFDAMTNNSTVSLTNTSPEKAVRGFYRLITPKTQ